MKFDGNRSYFNDPYMDNLKQHLNLSNCYRMANGDELEPNYIPPNGESSVWSDGDAGKNPLTPLWLVVDASELLFIFNYLFN